MLARCPACGHATTQRVTSHVGADGYAADAGARDRYEREYLAARTVSWSRGLALLEDARGGRLLDVGCNYGHFLVQARAAGWDVRGAEDGVRVRASALPDVASLIDGDLERAAAHGPFDAITLWDVLEHVRHPVAFLQRLAGLLTSGGRLLVRVPDARALTALPEPARQVYLLLCHPTNPEEHPHHYTPRSLASIGGQAGLKQVTVAAADPAERVAAGRSAADAALRRALHRMGAAIPYELTAVLEVHRA